VLSQAFEIFKQQWVVLVFAPLVLFVIYIAVSFGLQFPVTLLTRDNSTIAALAMIPVGLVQAAVYSWVYAGILKIYLAAARGQVPEFGDAFKAFDRVVPLFFGFLVAGLAYLVGFVLLIVPGIVLAIGCLFFPFYVVDQGAGPVEALKKSWAATSGHKMQLFLFGLVAGCIVIVGYLACLVGVAVAYPVVTLAAAIIYTRLSGTMGPIPPGGGGAIGAGYGAVSAGGYVPPGGGYSPPGTGGGYGPPGGGGYGPPGGGGGYGPPGGGGYGPPGGGGGYGPPGGQGG
jgi:hypothetical protein